MAETDAPDVDMFVPYMMERKEKAYTNASNPFTSSNPITSVDAVVAQTYKQAQAISQANSGTFNRYFKKASRLSRKVYL